ncbi:hypothetical protein LguiB_018428 [Lonicera macranthoides]
MPPYRLDTNHSNLAKECIKMKGIIPSLRGVFVGGDSDVALKISFEKNKSRHHSLSVSLFLFSVSHSHDSHSPSPPLPHDHTPQQHNSLDGKTHTPPSHSRTPIVSPQSHPLAFSSSLPYPPATTICTLHSQWPVSLIRLLPGQQYSTAWLLWLQIGCFGQETQDLGSIGGPVVECCCGCSIGCYLAAAKCYLAAELVAALAVAECCWYRAFSSTGGSGNLEIESGGDGGNVEVGGGVDGDGGTWSGDGRR